MAMAVRKELPARHSRGTRIRQLVGEEAEADASFWAQSAWNEDAEDDDYSTEDEEEDVVDSDFDEDENPDEEVHDQDADNDSAQRRRTAPQRSSVYREPTTHKTLVKKPRFAALDTNATNATNSAQLPPVTPSTFEYEAPTVRRSTARKSSVSSELRRRLSDTAVTNSSNKKSQLPISQQPQPIRFTQAQLLAEAVRTEVANVQSLSRLEQLEEERRAETLAPKAPFTGDVVRVHSRIGVAKTITFLNTTELPSLFRQLPPTKRARPKALENENDGHDDSSDDENDDE